MSNVASQSNAVPQFAISDFGYYAGVFQALEESDKIAGKHIELCANEAGGYSVRLVANSENDGRANASQRWNVLDAIRASHKFDESVINKVKLELFGEAKGGRDYDESIIGKPLDSRTFRRLDLLLSGENAATGSGMALIAEMDERVKSLANRFAKKCIANDYGVLFQKLENLFLKAFAEVVQAVGPDGLSKENLDKLALLADNKVFAENGELFDALNEAARISNKYVPADDGKDDEKNEDLKALKNSVNQAIGNSVLPKSLQKEAMDVIRACYKESIVQQLQKAEFNKPSEEALRKGAIASAMKMFKWLTETAPGFIDGVFEKVLPNEKPESKDMKSLRDLMVKMCVSRLMKAAQSDARGVLGFNGPAALYGTGEIPGWGQDFVTMLTNVVNARNEIGTLISKCCQFVAQEFRGNDFAEQVWNATETAYNEIALAIEKNQNATKEDLVTAAKKAVEDSQGRVNILTYYKECAELERKKNEAVDTFLAGVDVPNEFKDAVSRTANEKLMGDLKNQLAGGAQGKKSVADVLSEKFKEALELYRQAGIQKTEFLRQAQAKKSENSSEVKEMVSLFDLKFNRLRIWAAEGNLDKARALLSDFAFKSTKMFIQPQKKNYADDVDAVKSLVLKMFEKAELAGFVQSLENKAKELDKVWPQGTGGKSRSDTLAGLEKDIEKMSSQKALQYLQDNKFVQSLEEDYYMQSVGGYMLSNFTSLYSAQRPTKEDPSKYEEIGELQDSATRFNRAVKKLQTSGNQVSSMVNPSQEELAMIGIFRSKVLKFFKSDSGAAKNQLMNLCNDLAQAYEKAEKKEGVGLVIARDDVKNLTEALNKVSDFLEEKLKKPSEDALDEVFQGLDKSQQTLLKSFTSEYKLSIKSAEGKLSRIGLTPEEALKLPAETVELYSSMVKAGFDKSIEYNTIFDEVSRGILPAKVLSVNTLSLMRLLIVRNHDRIKGSGAYAEDYRGGLRTSSARELLLALGENGFLSRLDQLPNGDEDRDMGTLADALSLLCAVSNGTVGLDDMSLRVFKKDIFDVTREDVNAMIRKIEDQKAKDPDHPYAGIDPLQSASGVSKDIVHFLTAGGSASGLSFATGENAGDGLVALRNHLIQLRDNFLAPQAPGGAKIQPVSDLNLGGTVVKFEIEATSGRIHFTVGDLPRAATNQDIMSLIDTLTNDLVSGVKTYGVDAVRSLLPPREQNQVAGFDLRARDVCISFLQSVSGLPAIRFSQLGVDRLNSLAHGALDAMADKGKGPELVAGADFIRKELAGVPGLLLNTSETLEQCARLSKADEKEVSSKVVFAEEEGDKSFSPLRGLIADAFLLERSWEDDSGKDGYSRMRDVLIAHVNELRSLMANSKLFDELKVAVQPNGDAVVKPLKATLVALSRNLELKPGEVPTSKAVVDMLNDVRMKTTIEDLAAEFSKAGDMLVASAQTLFTTGFVAQLDQGGGSDSDDFSLQTLRQIAGSGKIDFQHGFGKFLGEAFSKYFNGLKGADRKALLRSLVANTTSDSTPVDVMVALVKGAGPVFQKLIQGVPKTSLPEKLWPVVECTKCSLDPIPRTILKAKLLDLVQRSGGRIESIEVKKSLGAASVGEALLCVVKTREAPVGEECVIKLLRPDAPTRAQREKDFLLTLTTDIPGVATTFESRYAGIEEEMDLSIEAGNVKLGAIYDPKDGAATDKVGSMRLNPILAPTSGSMVLQKAPGQTFDRFVKDTNNHIKDIAGKFRHQVEDKQTGEKRLVVSSLSIPQTIAAKCELVDLYNKTLKRHQQLIALSKKWFDEALFGAGAFHGDLHAGNVMTDEGALTLIDFGNVTQLSADDRKRLMCVAAACALNVPGDLVDCVQGMMSKEGQSKLASVRKGLEMAIGDVLSKGSSSDVTLRLAAVIRLLERNGLEIPGPLFNFSQSMERLQSTIESVEDTMLRIKALHKDIQFDDSNYFKAGDKVESGKTLPVFNVTVEDDDSTFGEYTTVVRFSKTNPLDYMGAFIDVCVKNFDKDRLNANNQPRLFEDVVELQRERLNPEINWPGMKGVKDYLTTTITGLLGNPADFAKLKGYLAEVLQARARRMHGIEDGKVETGDTLIDGELKGFESKQPRCWTDEAAKNDVANVIVSTLMGIYSADILAPTFEKPQSCGGALQDLIGEREKIVVQQATAGIKFAAAGYKFGSRSNVDKNIDQSAENANSAVEKWLDAHPGFSHYDAEQIKSFANELLVFNDKTFVYSGTWPLRSNWSTNESKRQNFLHGMKSNLKAIDERLAQLKTEGEDPRLGQLRRECLMTYYVEKTGFLTAFSNADSVSYPMKDEDYNTLLGEAEKMKGGGPLVELIKSIRAQATQAKG